jgi:hypothetical protein
MGKMSDFYYGKHQDTANRVCEKGQFKPVELDFLLNCFDFDEQWGVTVEQRLIRLGVLNETGLGEIFASWRRWLEALELLAAQEEREREVEAVKRLASVSPLNRFHTMTVFMWHAYDYTLEEVRDFIQVSNTARAVRGDVFRNVASRLDEYDGTISSMNYVLELFEPYKKHIEGPMKRKHESRLAPSSIRSASERLDAIRLKYSDDIN